MKRLWDYFTRIDLGYWLLMCVSLNLLVGVVLSLLYEAEFKRLNTMLMPDWFHTVSSRPVVYLWLVPLVILLALLAINTFVCTTSYVKTVINKKCFRVKLGIILFHVAFVVALAGHGISEFTGLNEAVILEKGQSVAIPKTDLVLEAVEINRDFTVVDGTKVRMGIEAILNVSTGDGVAFPLKVKALHPKFSGRYALHLSFMDMGLTQNQVRVIVRSDYGLFFILAGGMLAFLAIVLYIPAIKRSRS